MCARLKKSDSVNIQSVETPSRKRCLILGVCALELQSEERARPARCHSLNGHAARARQGNLDPAVQFTESFIMSFGIFDPGLFNYFWDNNKELIKTGAAIYSVATGARDFLGAAGHVADQWEQWGIPTDFHTLQSDVKHIGQAAYKAANRIDYAKSRLSSRHSTATSQNHRTYRRSYGFYGKRRFLTFRRRYKRRHYRRRW